MTQYDYEVIASDATYSRCALSRGARAWLL